MEVKDLKVSIAPQEVLELVWQQINNAISQNFWINIFRKQNRAL